MPKKNRTACKRRKCQRSRNQRRRNNNRQNRTIRGGVNWRWLRSPRNMLRERKTNKVLPLPSLSPQPPSTSHPPPHSPHLSPPPPPPPHPRNYSAVQADNAATTTSPEIIRWLYLNDDNKYTDYEPHMNYLLEFIFSKRNIDFKPNNMSECTLNAKPQAKFTIPYQHFVWEFDFNEMMQTNIHSGKRRPIIRLINDTIWIWYMSDIRDKFNFIMDIRASSFLTLYYSEGYRPRQFNYTTTPPIQVIKCDGNKKDGNAYVCNGDAVRIEKIDLATLIRLMKNKI